VDLVLASSGSRNAIYNDIIMSQGPREPWSSGRIFSELFENTVVDDLLARNLLASNIHNDMNEPDHGGVKEIIL
jgi:hypothetical protein